MAELLNASFVFSIVITPSLFFEKHFLSHDSEWIVFVHGAGGSTRTWRRQLEDFGSNYNLLLIDLPDHGGSADLPVVEDDYSFEGIGQRIWAAIDEAGVSRVHLTGLSLGSILVMEMERQQPTRVQSMLLGGAIVQLSLRLRIIARTSLGLAKVIGFRSFYKLAARIALPKQNHRKSRDVFIRESKTLSIPAFERWTRMYTGLDDHLKELFAHITGTPRILLMGSQDHLFGKAALRYSNSHPDAELHVVDACGHVVSIERPEAFNRVALRFLESLESKAGITSNEAASLTS